MDTAARPARAFSDAIVSGRADWPRSFAGARDAVTLEAYEDTASAADDLSVLDGRRP